MCFLTLLINQIMFATFVLWQPLRQNNTFKWRKESQAEVMQRELSLDTSQQITYRRIDHYCEDLMDGKKLNRPQLSCVMLKLSVVSYQCKITVGHNNRDGYFITYLLVQICLALPWPVSLGPRLLSAQREPQASGTQLEEHDQVMGSTNS